MNEVIGHEKILDFFDKVNKHDNLSHAYCLTGPAHIGKRTIAEYISTKLLDIDVDGLKLSPDFHIVERSINQKTGKLRKDISIDQVRQVIAALMQSAFKKDGYKIAIIDQADLMSSGASNALLKTLEEPKNKTVLFLITTDESRLLSTIQSRCQMIHVPLVSDEVLKKKLSSHNDRDKIIKAAAGRPGIALSWIEDEEKWKSYKAEIERFSSLFDQPFYKKLQSVEDMYGDKKDHMVARQNLQKSLSIWQTQLHFVMKEKKVMASDIVSVEKGISEALDLLGKNVHPRLLVEHILLQIP